MIPSDLFCDLVDDHVGFKVVQKNLNGPDFVFSVSRAAKGQLRLSMPGESLSGTADSILPRLNALLCENPTHRPQSLSLYGSPALDEGKCIDFTIVPEGWKGKRQGYEEAISVSCDIVAGDFPGPDPETAVVRVEVGNKIRFYLVCLEDKDRMWEVCRLSFRSMSRGIHAKVAAAGCFEDEFVEAYGEEAYEAALERREQVEANWWAGFRRFVGASSH